MAYPKPLSKQKIEKLFSDWLPQTVETLHQYYEAFANLYGMIRLDDAWNVFRQFEPKVSKKQFIAFSAIVRREDVPYCIYEIDEIYCEEPRKDTHRFIIHKNALRNGQGKFQLVYHLEELQYRKPYYAKQDLLEVAAHPLYDTELRRFISQMAFQSGKQKGKLFSKAYFLTDDEQFLLSYYKSERKRTEIQKRAEIPFSEKFFEEILYLTTYTNNVLRYSIEYLEENGYTFASKKSFERFTSLLVEFNNRSHLWSNCGFSPMELSVMHSPKTPPTISFGPGLQQAFADGTLSKEELVRRLHDMGITAEDTD